MSKQQAKVAAPAVPAIDTPTSAHDPDAETAAALVGAATDPFVLGLIVHGNPRHRDTIIAYLTRQHGNAFVVTVLDYAAEADAKLATTGVDHSAVADSGRLASGEGEASTAVAKTPDPTERLPYDRTGGWAGVQINLHLGQHDKLVGTDSDAERCSFAVALAAQIFAGPTTCARWLVEYVASHATMKGKVDKDQAGAVSLRRKTAARTLAAIADAIGAGTATYGDLSWAQEALHALSTADDHAGSEGGASVVVPGLEAYHPMNSVTDDPARVMALATALPEGGRLTLALVGEYADGRDEYIHQLSINRHEGKLYTYDPEWPTGDHLDLTTAGDLGRYLDKRVFSSASFVVQGMVTPKTDAAKADAKAG